jgi:hypothetical protein
MSQRASCVNQVAPSPLTEPLHGAARTDFLERVNAMLWGRIAARGSPPAPSSTASLDYARK